MPFVLDCSVTMSWVFSDEGSPDTVSLLERLTADHAVVPQIWCLEVVNVLLSATRRGRIQAKDRPHLVDIIRTLPIEVNGETHRQAWLATMGVAAEFGLSAYDAAYLELALRRNLPLATLDSGLAKACEAAGVASVIAVGS